MTEVLKATFNAMFNGTFFANNEEDGGRAQWRAGQRSTPRPARLRLLMAKYSQQL